MGKETHLPALSRVAPLQQDQGAWGDGGGGGSQALPLLLDEMVTEQPRLEEKTGTGRAKSKDAVREGEQVSDKTNILLGQFSLNNMSEYMGIHCTVLSTLLYVLKFP